MKETKILKILALFVASKDPNSKDNSIQASVLNNILKKIIICGIICSI